MTLPLDIPVQQKHYIFKTSLKDMSQNYHPFLLVSSVAQVIKEI